MGAYERRFRVISALAGAVLAACVSIAGCSGGSSESKAAMDLREGTGTDWVVSSHPDFKTTSFALPKNGAVPLPNAGSTADSVLELLDRYKEALGMSHPKSEWVLESTLPGDGGFTHLRFRQQTRGVTVFESGWTVAVDGSGRLASMSGVYVPGVDAIDITPAQTPDAISTAVQSDVRKRLPGLGSAPIQAEVEPSPVIYASAQTAPALAFRVFSSAHTASESDESNYLVDAHTGKILSRSSAVASDAYAEGYGASHYAPYNGGEGKVSFPVSHDRAWVLDGQTNGAKVRVFTTVDDGSRRTGDSIAGRDASGSTDGPPKDWVDDSLPKGAAIDAQSHLAAVVDAYKDVYGRSSFDDRGGQIIIKIRSRHMVNASWTSSGCNGYMAVEGGNPDESQWPYKKVYPLGVSNDVMAHELTHAVTACTWGGGSSGDAPAINEAMSDILAEFISGKIEGGTPTIMGRHASPDETFLVRDLANPHNPNNLGGKPLCAAVGDNCDDEEHAKSTIVSYAWYLMTKGGVHITTKQAVSCPIGWEASRKLWYEVETKDLRPGPDFKAVAQATLSAGKRMKLTLDPIACAWVAVKVLTADEAKKDWNVTCTDSATSASGTDGGGGGLVTPSGPLVCPGSTGL